MQFDSGADPAAAAALAKTADVAIVFAYQWESEGMDLDSLSLPDNQDELIAKVAAANPHTVVVIESGGPVTMPWVDQVSAILEAWFAGSRGAEAVANVIFGDVNPSAKLPITFPKSEADLPHPTIVKPPKVTRDADSKGWRRIAAGLPAFQVTYNEGVKVGYKWYDAENKPVLFPFGYGLVLHYLLVLESEGDAGKESSRKFHGYEHGQSRWSRSRGSVCFPTGRGGGASETPGGMEQGQAQRRREQRGCGRGGPEVSLHFQR